MGRKCGLSHSVREGSTNLTFTKSSWAPLVPVALSRYVGGAPALPADRCKVRAGGTVQAGPWWWRWAGSGWAPWALLAVTLLLGAPAFRVGLLFEDWGQRMLLVGDTFDPLQVFRLARDPEELRAAQGIGLAPWWADPEVRLAFLRPVSALTHRLDWRWWPDAPWAHVLHTFAWWAAAGFAAWRAYLRLLPSRAAAALATFAWAADDARGTAVGWLANRNTFVASAFGLAALALHLRARDTGEAWARWLAVGMLGAALFSAEAGVGACVYLLAVSVALEPRWTARGAPCGRTPSRWVPWLVAWKGLGFGAARSGAYVDPVSEPLRWVVAAAERAPLDWAAQWTGPLATASSMTAFPERVGWLLPAAAVCAAVLGWAAPLARADARSAAALGGSLLALLPVASVFPSERVLAFVGFGASALVAGPCTTSPPRRTCVGSRGARRPGRGRRSRWCWARWGCPSPSTPTGR
jgi:hypothetical protein